MARLSKDQWGVVRGGGIGIAVAVLLGAAGYAFLPPELVGAARLDTAGDRLAFALKWDVVVLLWLALCIRQVSDGRFRSAQDIDGSAYTSPSPAIAVRRAVLQNSLEQSVLAIGAHLALASVLRGRELVAIPVLVGLFLVGRVAFAVGYRGRAPGRAPGMVLTAAPTLAALLLAAGLALAGR